MYHEMSAKLRAENDKYTAKIDVLQKTSAVNDAKFESLRVQNQVLEFVDNFIHHAYCCSCTG